MNIAASIPQNAASSEATPEAASEWVYLRVYLGAAIDRMDWFLIAVRPALDSHPDIQRWFFIRYVDDGGIHVRLRAEAKPGRAGPVRTAMADAVSTVLGRISQQPPGTYTPMVTAPGFADQMDQLAVAHNDLRIVDSDYEPELDKFGGPAGMPLAEALFHASSRIACDILDAEAAGRMSRKGLLPALMQACHRAFQPETDAALFWREYAYYWLGSKTPAAEDWRERFSEKAAALSDAGVSALDPDPGAAALSAPILADWTAALSTAADGYRALGPRSDANREVLTFTVAHLMNNRLGVAVLEEAYLASLLEAAVKAEGQAA